MQLGTEGEGATTAGSSHTASQKVKENKKDNPVPNRIQPRKQPGLYMIRCIINDFRYYGESNNVSGRLASHRSLLIRKMMVT